MVLRPLLMSSILAGALLASVNATAAAPPAPTDTPEARIQSLEAERDRNRELIVKLQTELQTLRPLAQQQQTAEQANAEGLKFYQKGDYESAVVRFRKAVAGDLPSAMTNLGLAYLNGQGVPQDIKQASALLERASGLGEVSASESLGKMYELALGVHFDRYRAIQYYTVALQQGSAIAGERLAQLEQGGDQHRGRERRDANRTVSMTTSP